MAFLSILSEDIQRYVIQSWVLPEKASTSAVLKLWSRLDTACCNHGLQPYLRSPYPWQMDDTGPSDRHTLGISDLRGFCRWIAARGLLDVEMPFTLPMVNSLGLLPLKSRYQQMLSRLCPHVTTVAAASPPDFSSGQLQFLISVGWGIRLEDLKNVDVLQRISSHVVELRIGRRPYDEKIFVAIASHCPNLRVIELGMPLKEVPDTDDEYVDEPTPLPGANILVLYLMSKCKQCEELILHSYGHYHKDVTCICQTEGHNLKRVSFPNWYENQASYLDPLADILAKCPFLDFVCLGECSYNRKTKTLMIEDNQHYLGYSYVSSDWALFKQCAGIEHLTIANANLFVGTSEAEILSEGLGSHLLTLNLHRIHGDGAGAIVHHCTQLLELRIDGWSELADDDLALIGKFCPRLRLLHVMVAWKTGKLSQDGVIAALNGWSKLKSLSLLLFEGALTRAFLSHLFLLSCLETVTFSRKIGLNASDVTTFRQAARMIQRLLPIAVIEFVDL